MSQSELSRKILFAKNKPEDLAKLLSLPTVPNVAAITTADASTEATVYALANACKAKINELITALSTGSVLQDKIATPTASPAAGPVRLGSLVFLSSATADVDIYYTINGSDPTTASLKYTSAGVVIDAAKTIKAIAVKDGATVSGILSSAYTQAKAATPVANPAEGAVAENAPVVLTCATEGADIYYTLDETDPDADATLYEEPILIAEAVTIKAIAILAGYTNSSVLSAAYTVT